MGELLSRFRPENIKDKTKQLAPRLALTAALSVAVPLHTPQAGAEDQLYFSDYGIRLGQQRIGVVILDLDGNPNPEGVERIQNILEGEDRSPYGVEEYYHRASKGQIDFDFYVSGPYSINTGLCDEEVIAQAGSNVLLQNGENPNQYDAMMYITEEVPEGGCRYEGGSYQGAFIREDNSIVILGNKQTALIAHELAHFLGFSAHANGYECGDQLMTPENCSKSRGDPTDLLGYADSPKMYYNFNAPHKIALGIISENEIKTIKKSGIYTIIGSETNKKGTHVLKIKANEEMFGENAYVFIEYRQPLPEFSESFASEFVVNAWTGNIDDPTYYLGSLNCSRRSCDSLELHSGTTTVDITSLSEGEQEGQVKIEMGKAI